MTHQAHRNADIMAFVPAMRLLVERGFTVVRMGDPTMRPLPPLDGVIDYCHHPARDPWLDIYLMASAQFFVGCTSGLVMVAHVFGTPTALSYFVPPCARPYTNQDLFLPRLYWSQREERVLSFPELLTPPLATTFYYDRLRSQGIRALDPTEDDITALTGEMWERWRGTVAYSPEDEARQARYDALNSRVPWFGSNGRVGRDFLRAHADLLEQYSNELSG
jgi:putative glycosyltransferase (TIGR04372 family)